jgi:hypothetical protein
MELMTDYFIDVDVNARIDFRLPPKDTQEQIARNTLEMIIRREGRKFNAVIQDKIEKYIEAELEKHNDNQG